MESIPNDPRTPVREFAGSAPPATLLPIWLWVAFGAFATVMFVRGWTFAGIVTVAYAAICLYDVLKKKLSPVYAGPGWLRRGKHIVKIDHLTSVKFKFTLRFEVTYPASDPFDAILTDRDGRTLRISTEHLREDSIRGIFKAGLHKSIASGLKLDARTHKLMARYLGTA